MDLETVVIIKSLSWWREGARLNGLRIFIGYCKLVEN